VKEGRKEGRKEKDGVGGRRDEERRVLKFLEKRGEVERNEGCSGWKS